MRHLGLPLSRLKKIVAELERGAHGVPPSRVQVYFYLHGKKDCLMEQDSKELSLTGVGQFGVVPDATFRFKERKK